MDKISAILKAVCKWAENEQKLLKSKKKNRIKKFAVGDFVLVLHDARLYCVRQVSRDGSRIQLDRAVETSDTNNDLDVPRFGQWLNTSECFYVDAALVSTRIVTTHYISADYIARITGEHVGTAKRVTA